MAGNIHRMRYWSIWGKVMACSRWNDGSLIPVEMNKAPGSWCHWYWKEAIAMAVTTPSQMPAFVILRKSLSCAVCRSLMKRPMASGRLKNSKCRRMGTPDCSGRLFLKDRMRNISSDNRDAAWVDMFLRMDARMNRMQGTSMQAIPHGVHAGT